jgi:outer membrane assembly lipoprotein YfiO
MKRNKLWVKIKLCGWRCSFLVVILLLAACSKQRRKEIEDMNFIELKNKTISSLKRHNKRIAIAALEQLVTQHSDNQNIASYKLMLADLYFKTGRYIQSYELYDHFRELYPSDVRAEFASYRSILSKYHQMSRMDRDSTETENTLELCKKHLLNPQYLRYRKDVGDIERTCRQRLVDKEVYVYNVYLRQKKLKSAENRLKHLRDTYLSTEADLEPRLLYLEGKLARRKKESETVKEKVITLVNKYPDSPFTRMARSLVMKKKRFLF